ncbi:hypothetical protein GCM10027053_45930 [Intrasporangium mesophilum]
MVGSAGKSAFAVSAPVGAIVIIVAAALRALLMRHILPVAASCSRIPSYAVPAHPDATLTSRGGPVRVHSVHLGAPRSRSGERPVPSVT